MNDLQLAQQCQAQYNGRIPLRTVAKVDFSVVHNEGVVDLIFQGTTNLEDAKCDLEALMINVTWGLVHSGAWIGITQVIDAAWDDFSEDIPIRVSGHSLGAMRAALGAYELYIRGFRNLEVVTFASPLWGDARAIQNFNQIKNRTYRNYLDFFHHDLFTTVPLHLPKEPYMPVPNCTTFWAAPTIANEWHGAGELIEAHSLSDCYIPALRRIYG